MYDKAAQIPKNKENDGIERQPFPQKFGRLWNLKNIIKQTVPLVAMYQAETSLCADNKIEQLSCNQHLDIKPGRCILVPKYASIPIGRLDNNREL